MARFSKLFGAILLIASSFACGGPSPVAPNEVVTPSPTVMAPPPAGVSAEVWKVGFRTDDNRLYRPDAVHLQLPDSFDPDTKAMFAKIVGLVSGFIDGKTPMDLVPGPIGATFQVSIDPSISQIDPNLGALISFDFSPKDGKISGGTIRFVNDYQMHHDYEVMHEVFRTLGLQGTSPVPGIMAINPWTQLRPSDEEKKMLLGRYDYPTGAIYVP